MGEFTAADHRFMARALELAVAGRYTARPNPKVGCVLVLDGRIIGESGHRRAGEPHAEVLALEAAGNARGASAYVTLEPCAHHGRTPPCVDALVAAGVSEVTCAMQDPNPAVNGRGLAILHERGIRVRCGLMQAAAERMNRGFLSRVSRGRPFVRLKIAASLDGGTAMQSGESQWVSGPAARKDVHRMRAESGAILTGIGTVLADDPSLTVRDAGLPADLIQPLRAIVDTGLRMPLSARMLCLPGTTIVYCADDSERGRLEDAGATVQKVATRAHRLELAAVLADLGRREVNDVFVEAGPTLAGALLDDGLIDELVIYQAPHVMGSETNRMFTTPAWTSLASRRDLCITDRRRVGKDLRITAQWAD